VKTVRDMKEDIKITPLYLDRVLQFEIEYAHSINEMRDRVIELTRELRNCLHKYTKESGGLPLVVVLESLMDLCAEVWVRLLLDLSRDYNEVVAKEANLVLQKLLGMKIIHYTELIKEEGKEE